MFIFADALDYVMLFNVYAMGFFDRRFTRKAYLFSSKYIHDQSGGRIPTNTVLDDLYRNFITFYRKELSYVPNVKSANKQEVNKLIHMLTEWLVNTNTLSVYGETDSKLKGC